MQSQKHVGLFCQDFGGIELPIAESSLLLNNRVADILDAETTREQKIALLVAMIRAREAETCLYFLEKPK